LYLTKHPKLSKVASVLQVIWSEENSFTTLSSKTY